ncbi:MAG: hypothetical protein K0R82_143 [Flavipsychrobacter sp.]|jgi:hypothetical protein|nr:hypothetical protein [Flavipsychrobacter sp.]
MQKFFTNLSLSLLALTLFATTAIKAQMPSTAAGYAFTAYQDVYNPLSGGTTVAINADDKTLSGFPIGFTFPFTTGNYTTVSASSNGWLSFIATTSSGAGNTTGNATSFGPMVIPLWDDLNGAPNGVASYLTTGTAPNRVFVFEWRNWRWYYNSTGNNVISYQVKLYETGRIEFVYSQGPDPISSSSSATISATIGIAKSGTDYLTLNLPTTSPTASSTTFTTSIAAKPATGQVYAWDKPCNAPSSVIASGITNKSASVSWGAIPLSLGYEYILSQSATPPPYNATGVTATSSTTINFPSLSSGTTYYFYVRNKCSTNFSPWTAYSFSTLGCFSPGNLLIKYITDTSASMLWSHVAGADNYQYALSFNKQIPPVNIVTTNSITHTFTGLTPNSKYYFFLRSRCFGVDSSGWKIDSFVTLINCYTPVVKVNELGTNQPYAYWDPIPTAFAYEYAITNSSTPPAFGTTIYVPYYGISLPADGNDYYLHVRTKCNGMYTYSDWSTTTLRTGITNVPETVGDAIKIYPNPVRNSLFVENVDGARYTVTDLAGREILQGDVKGLKATIATGSLSSGVYLLQLELGGEKQTHRFTKD